MSFSLGSILYFLITIIITTTINKYSITSNTTITLIIISNTISLTLTYNLSTHIITSTINKNSKISITIITLIIITSRITNTINNFLITSIISISNKNSISCITAITL